MVRRPVVSLPKIALQKLVGLIPSPQDPLTLEGVRAQVNRHRQRILRLSLLNERLQNYLKARARKKPPLRPPDPQVLSVHVPSSVSSCGSQSLGLFTPDHLSIVISEMSLGKTGSTMTGLRGLCLNYAVCVCRFHMCCPQFALARVRK